MTSVRCTQLLSSLIRQSLSATHHRLLFTESSLYRMMLFSKRGIVNSPSWFSVTKLTDNPFKDSTLFSTSSTTLQNNEQLETAKSAAVNKKWHSQRKIYVFSGLNFDYSEDYLKELFTQFGVVETVNITQVNSSHGYAIISFENIKSAKKALSTEKITLTSDRSLIIRKQKRTRTHTKTKKTYVVYGLPDDITVSQLETYLSKICSVERINLIVNYRKYIYESNNIANKSNYAVILLKEPNDSLLEMDHQLNESLLTVSKVADNFKFRIGDECQKLFIEGLPKTATDDDLRSHFKVYGNVRHVHINRDRTRGLPNGSGYVHFTDIKSAQFAAEDYIQDLYGSPVRVRVMGYQSE